MKPISITNDIVPIAEFKTGYLKMVQEPQGYRPSLDHYSKWKAGRRSLVAWLSMTSWYIKNLFLILLAEE